MKKKEWAERDTVKPYRPAPEVPPWHYRYASTFACVMGVFFVLWFVATAIFNPDVSVLVPTGGGACMSFFFRGSIS